MAMGSHLAPAEEHGAHFAALEASTLEHLAGVGDVAYGGTGVLRLQLVLRQAEAAEVLLHGLPHVAPHLFVACVRDVRLFVRHARVSRVQRLEELLETVRVVEVHGHAEVAASSFRLSLERQPSKDRNLLAIVMASTSRRHSSYS